jgi:hypothetical protein
MKFSYKAVTLERLYIALTINIIVLNSTIHHSINNYV